MSFRGGRAGGFGGASRGGGRASFGARGGGRGGGRGGRGGGRGMRDEGPPDHVTECGKVIHECESELVCKLNTSESKIPYFNAGIFLENKKKIGKIDEIFGPINMVMFTIKMDPGIVAKSFQEDDLVYIDVCKLLPLTRFTNPGGGGGGRSGDGEPEEEEVGVVVAEEVEEEAVVQAAEVVDEPFLVVGEAEVQGAEVVDDHFLVVGVEEDSKIIFFVIWFNTIIGSV
eukprot:CAMPEP_0201867054 /NCGR_PEP_ID=MMETSP0902-20130614/1441_1 /ASSEMBLY_ACC=CAM_ASM_000551 /TAXON_ID=420261 /ORGANISM="Thalassiosira antarctica, Strain CCMP982" /LENGTH=227 /DNA_ID=CAMNT_0048392163 /DNA_START=187 /DNA_END=871 /DNA_ORIENTATION=-